MSSDMDMCIGMGATSARLGAWAQTLIWNESVNTGNRHAYFLTHVHRHRKRHGRNPGLCMRMAMAMGMVMIFGVGMGMHVGMVWCVGMGIGISMVMGMCMAWGMQSPRMPQPWLASEQEGMRNANSASASVSDWLKNTGY